MKSHIIYSNDRMFQYLNTSIYVSIYDFYPLSTSTLLFLSALLLFLSKRHVACGKNYWYEIFCWVDKNLHDNGEKDFNV